MLKHCFHLGLFLTLLGYIPMYGQELKPGVFASLSGFRHTGFDDNLFTDFELGLSASSKYWITPKISYKNTRGELNTQQLFEKNIAPPRVEEELRTFYSGNLFGVGAEMRLTRKEDFWLFIWPRYYFGNFKFQGDFLKGAGTHDLVYTEILKETSFESYLDFSVGFAGHLDDAEKLTASAFVTYTTMNLENVFKSLDFIQTNLRAYENTQTVGLGFMIAYTFW